MELFLVVDLVYALVLRSKRCAILILNADANQSDEASGQSGFGALYIESVATSSRTIAAKCDLCVNSSIRTLLLVSHFETLIGRTPCTWCNDV